MTDWTAASGPAITAAIRDGAVTAEAVTEAHLASIARRNPALNAYTAVTEDRARAAARAIDRRRKAGEALPPLAGVPYAVKNLFDIAGLPTLAGARINRDRAAAAADATAISRMDAAGAILLGALNMGEYAYDFTGMNVHDGDMANPHDTARMTGGSSGGSGGAVAGGLATITLGSDTNGSIRVPASFCGVFGLKPTYGALSRGGSFPFVASLDHVGPLARGVADLALAFDAMAGADPRDPACRPRAAPPLAAGLDGSIAGLRIARIAGPYFEAAMQAEAAAALDTVATALGATRPLRLPEVARARSAAFLITMIEGAALHRERLIARRADFDPAVRGRLLAGAMLPGHWYVAAQRFRRWYRAAVLEAFRDIDALLIPATAFAAPLRGDTRKIMINSVPTPLRAAIGLFSQPISFIGLPVVAVPVWPGNLPVAVQIVTRPGREDIALRLARRLELDGVARAPVATMEGESA